MTGEQIIQTRDQLASKRQPLISHWDELAELFLPFRSLDAAGTPDILAADELFDSTSRRSALILANGLASLVTPREEVWFEWQPPRHLRKNDDAVRFYREATETGREFIEASNFYEEIQECYIESPVFGTTSLYIGGLDDEQSLHFRNQPIKTYYIAEDHRGRVNQLYRDLHLTAEQAAEEFGKDALPQEIAGKLGTAAGKTETFEFVHAVYRRTAIERDAPENLRKPWADEVVYVKTKTVVRRSGVDEFPFAVHRYRRFGRCPWGFGPGSVAKGDPRQLNFLNQLVDAGTEKAVFPPIVAPNTLEGEIGLGALEITYVDPGDPNAAAMLREWAPAGNLNHAAARMEDKRRQIEQAFHVDLFQLFAMRAQERAPMTATEASLVAGEKLTQFSPVFGRLVSEMLDPILTRVFGVLLRAGFLGQPPAAVTAEAGIAAPSVLYKNRILLAMQARQNNSLYEFMGLASPIIQLDPTAADALRLPSIIRDSARNAGLPEAWIRSEKEIDAMQAARQEEAARQQALAEAGGIADAAGKLGVGPQVGAGIASAIQP